MVIDLSQYIFDIIGAGTREDEKSGKRDEIKKIVDSIIISDWMIPDLNQLVTWTTIKLINKENVSVLQR